MKDVFKGPFSILSTDNTPIADTGDYYSCSYVIDDDTGHVVATYDESVSTGRDCDHKQAAAWMADRLNALRGVDDLHISAQTFVTRLARGFIETLNALRISEGVLGEGLMREKHEVRNMIAELKLRMHKVFQAIPQTMYMPEEKPCPPP